MDRPRDLAGASRTQFWATSAATRSIPLGVAGTAHWPLGRAWADGYAERDGRWWPRFDPQNVDPVMGPVFA